LSVYDILLLELVSGKLRPSAIKLNDNEMEYDIQIHLKVGCRGKFWLIRISMSPNLPESNYSARDTAEVSLNLC